MKIVLINKSDRTGGAAVVTQRLMHALRNEGVDARMLVVEKLTESPHISLAASHQRAALPFIAERLKIFLSNGFSRQNLFKADTASDGLALWRHPWVKEADAVCLNWVNQGMLSLRGIRNIAKLGKPIVWTMHDMWNATGVCHHAGECPEYGNYCRHCPLICGDKANAVWKNKQQLYKEAGIHFVAVSNWLAKRCRQSDLMRNVNISVIPNAFPLDEFKQRAPYEYPEPIRIVMGAARLDDPIKGLPILIEACKRVKEADAQLAERLEVVTFGGIRNSELLKQISIRHTHLGVISDVEQVKEVYRRSHIVISTSLYETLPGTLIEGQAQGCLAVAFDSGGQSDIIDHKITGYLAPLHTSSDSGVDIEASAQEIVRGLFWSIREIESAKYGRDEASHGECGRTAPYNISQATYESVRRKFDASQVARQYIQLFNSLISE